MCTAVAERDLVVGRMRRLCLTAADHRPADHRPADHRPAGELDVVVAQMTRVPDRVVAALRTVGEAAVDPSRASAPTICLAVEPAGVTARADAALALIEAVETVHAWADSVADQGWRTLRSELFSAVVDPPDYADASMSRRRELDAEVRSLVVSEVEAATGLGVGECQRRAGFALASPAATRAARAAMREGACSAYRARTVLQDTADLFDQDRDRIAAEVLSPRPDGLPRSHAQFRRRLRQLIVAHQPLRGEEDRCAAALAARCAYGELEPDGTGVFSVRGGASRVSAATRRIEAIARRVRARGDARTLSQVRSDVALDLLLYGWFDLSAVGPADARRPAAVGADAQVVAGSPAGYDPQVGFLDPVADPAPGRIASLSAYTHVGEPPPARVELVVSLTTLLGVDDGIGEIPGHGFVTAAAARRIALAAGSVWARLVTDPVSGQAVDVSTHRYRPGERIARVVRARDRTCRGPGCTTPASSCDLDHERPWDIDLNGMPVGGLTSVDNLYAKHRRHHNLKTRRYWTSSPGPDATLTWTTACGRRYATGPADYRDLLPPAAQSRSSPTARPGPPPSEPNGAANDMSPLHQRPLPPARTGSTRTRIIGSRPVDPDEPPPF